MKRDTAQELWEALHEADVAGRHWELHKPEFERNGRQVSYYVRFTAEPFRGENIPSPPQYAHILDDLDVEHISTHFRHITEEEKCIDYPPNGDSLQSVRYSLYETPRYEFILDNYERHDIPRTPEEERQKQLGADIRDAIDLPANTDAGIALAEHFDRVGDILAADDETLLAIDGIGEKTVDAIRARMSPELARQKQRLRKENGYTPILIAVEGDDGILEPAYDRHTAEDAEKKLLGGL